MGCATSCIATSIAGLDKSIRNGDERGVILKLSECPRLLSSPCFAGASTPLHRACKAGKAKIVQGILHFLLASAPETVRAALLSHCCRTREPLPTTAAEGVFIAVNMLNAKGQTPLMLACSSDCPEIVQLLLANGADPWATDRVGGRAAVHYAAMYNSTACLNALFALVPRPLDTGRPIRYVDLRSRCGLTALHYCVYFSSMEALRELLLHHEPDLNVLTTAECPDLSLLFEPRSSPLHVAALVGNVDAAREILLHFAHQFYHGRRILDPRTLANAAGQLPWQVSVAVRPGSPSLAMLLNPRQPLERTLGVRLALQDMPSSVSRRGPPTLTFISAAAVRRKLLADLEKAQREMAAAVRNVSERAASVIVAPEQTAAQSEWVEWRSRERGPSGCSGRHGMAVGSATRDGLIDSIRIANSVVASSTMPSMPASFADTAGNLEETHAVEMFHMHHIKKGAAAEADGAVPGYRGNNARQDTRMDEETEEEKAEQEGECGVCLADPVAVAPEGCRHGLCTSCAERLCRSLAKRPLQCPFCRKVVSSFVAHVG